MKLAIYEVLETINLPNNFRFFQFDGRKIFDEWNQDGTRTERLQCQLLVAPKEISDYDLKRTDIIASRLITFESNELNVNYPKDLMNLVKDKLKIAIDELQQEITK